MIDPMKILAEAALSTEVRIKHTHPETNPKMLQVLGASTKLVMVPNVDLQVLLAAAHALLKRSGEPELTSQQKFEILLSQGC